MPQKSLNRTESYRTKIRKNVFSPMVKIGWPLIPKEVFLGKLRRVSVELTAICNANCVFCAYRFQPENREKTHMPEDVFERLVQEVERAQVSEIMIPPDLGEPSLAPDLIRKIEAFRQAGVTLIEMTTNAIALHKVGVEELLAKGPDIINISTAGFNEEAFLRVYRCRGYETMKKNLLELLKKNRDLVSPRRINVWLRSDIPVEEMIKAPGMDVVMALASEVCWMTEVDSWNGRIKPEMLPGLLRLQTGRNKLTVRPCGILFLISVRPDGSVHACSCRNIENNPDLVLGDIRERGLLACYRNLEKVMDRWEQGEIPGICRNCDMYCDPVEVAPRYLADYLSERCWG